VLEVCTIMCLGVKRHLASGHEISRLEHEHGLQLIMARYTRIINCRPCCNLGLYLIRPTPVASLSHWASTIVYNTVAVTQRVARVPLRQLWLVCSKLHPRRRPSLQRSIQSLSDYGFASIVEWINDWHRLGCIVNSRLCWSWVKHVSRVKLASIVVRL